MGSHAELGARQAELDRREAALDEAEAAAEQRWRAMTDKVSSKRNRLSWYTTLTAERNADWDRVLMLVTEPGL